MKGIGNWEFPMCKENAYGTLIIEKEFMTLRILISNSIQWKWKETLNIKGKAFKQKRNEKLRICEFDFLLRDLRILKYANSESTFHELIFDVREAYKKILQAYLMQKINVPKKIISQSTQVLL